MRLLNLLATALLLALPIAAKEPGDEPILDSHHDDYDENLLLKTLPGNSVLASFRFVTNGTYNNSHHHTLFPRSLAQILEHSHARELHLKFSLGRWDAERWGAQISEGGATGVELWAWLSAPSSSAADQRWTSLTNALSGLFCASLNFIDSTRTIRPEMSFVPEGDHRDDGGLHLLYGSLPREPVCTENLTPFLKLLPCKGRAGIASLLDGHKLFDAQWQSMSVSVRPVCDGGRCRMQLEQTVDMVLDIERSLQRRDSPVPRPRPVSQLSCDPNRFYGADGDECFPQANLADLPWSLSEMFGRPITGACPLAKRSTGGSRTVCAEVPAQRPIYIASKSDANEAKSADQSTRCFSLPTDGGQFDFLLPAQSPPLQNAVSAPPLYASRSFTGHGQERGGVQAILINPSSKPVNVVYLESLPWFMKPYLHTLTTTLSPPSDTSPLTHLLYRPALDRARGTHLEAALSIPPNSTLTLTYDFDKAVLRYTEYPPDANRGFDVAPAIVTVGGPRGQRYSVRTTSLLLSLPTPDFSMPYNVIILTSTVMALAFGSVFNILVRRLVGKDEAPKKRGSEAVKRGLRLLGAKLRGLGREEKRKVE